MKGWLGKVVLYIENPEKTENPQFYRQKNMTDVQVQNLSDVIDYAARLDKTTEALDSESVSVLRQLVSGINCLPATGHGMRCWQSRSASARRTVSSPIMGISPLPPVRLHRRWPMRSV